MARLRVRATGAGASWARVAAEASRVTARVRLRIARMFAPSRVSVIPRPSLVAQGIDGFHASGLIGRQIPEKEDGRTGHHKCQDDAGPGNGYAQIAGQKHLRRDRNRQPDENSDDRPAAADQKSLDQKLIEN